jgi:hypothetical protein
MINCNRIIMEKTYLLRRCGPSFLRRLELPLEFVLLLLSLFELLSR